MSWGVMGRRTVHFIRWLGKVGRALEPKPDNMKVPALARRRGSKASKASCTLKRNVIGAFMNRRMRLILVDIKASVQLL